MYPLETVSRISAFQENLTGKMPKIPLETETTKRVHTICIGEFYSNSRPQLLLSYFRCVFNICISVVLYYLIKSSSVKFGPRYSTKCGLDFGLYDEILGIENNA